VAAKLDPFDQAYFDREIKPLFDHPLVEYLGEVDEAEKCRLLAGAYALLFFSEVFSRARVITTGTVPYLDFMAPGIFAQSVLFV
jgi:hypothetical protein